MAEFNPGDRISLVNEDVEGKVISIMNDNTILVELEDGLEIPLSTEEVVLNEDFTSKRKKYEDNSFSESREVKPTGNEGVFLAFDKSKSEEVLDLYVINNTTHDVMFSLFEQHHQKMKGITRGTLGPVTSQKVTTANLRHFEDWYPWVFQAIFFSSKAANLPEPVLFNFKPKAKSFFNALTQAPVLNKPAYLFNALKNQSEKKNLSIKGKQKPAVNIKMEKPPREVDLHAEKLIKNPEALESGEILQVQFRHFQNCLEKAIAANYPNIVFIHGVGSGKLKNRMLDHLKIINGVREYRNADAGKYGYGATEVILS